VSDPELEPATDTHVHLDFPHFDADRPEVLKRARQAGVKWMVNPGADLASSRRAVQLAASCEGVFAAVGIHPHDARTWTNESWEELRFLTQHPKVVAIGEIGLDYYRDRSPRDVQVSAFRRQIELAEELRLPAIIHARESHNDVLSILEERRRAGSRLKGVFHAFSGGVDEARRVLDLGFFIGVGGPVTFHNARRLVEIIPTLPVDRLLVETDCPYLAPHPYRGQRNEPAYVRLVIDRLAEIVGCGAPTIARQTTLNAHGLFGLSWCGAKAKHSVTNSVD